MRKQLACVLFGALIGAAVTGAWGWQEYHERAARFLTGQMFMELRALEGTPIDEWNSAQRIAFLQLDMNFQSLEKVMNRFLWNPRDYHGIERLHEQALARLRDAGGPLYNESRNEDGEDN